MTNVSNTEISAEAVRKIWMEKAYEQLRISKRIIRKHQDIIDPIMTKMKELGVAEFCAWITVNYPHVHFLTLNLDYREIEIHAIYDVDKKLIDDPDEVAEESIAEYANQHYAMWELDNLWSIGMDMDMLDIYEISQRKP